MDYARRATTLQPAPNSYYVIISKTSLFWNVWSRLLNLGHFFLSELNCKDFLIYKKRKLLLKKETTFILTFLNSFKRKRFGLNYHIGNFLFFDCVANCLKFNLPSWNQVTNNNKWWLRAVWPESGIYDRKKWDFQKKKWDEILEGRIFGNGHEIFD